MPMVALRADSSSAPWTDRTHRPGQLRVPFHSAYRQAAHSASGRDRSCRRAPDPKRCSRSCRRRSRTLPSRCLRRYCPMGTCSGPRHCTPPCTRRPGTPDWFRKIHLRPCTLQGARTPCPDPRWPAWSARGSSPPERKRRSWRSKCSRCGTPLASCTLSSRTIRYRWRAGRCRRRRSGTRRRRSCTCTGRPASRSRSWNRPSTSRRSCRGRRPYESGMASFRCRCRRPGCRRSRSPSHICPNCRRCTRRRNRPIRSPPARREFAFARFLRLGRPASRTTRPHGRAGS